MIATNRINQLFLAKDLTSGNRIIALVFLIINLPGILLSILFLPSLIIFFPGLILYAFYFKIFRETISIKNAKRVWVITMVYRMILAVGFLIVTDLDFYWVSMYHAFTAAMAGIAYFDLREEETASLIEAQQIENTDETRIFGRENQSENCIYSI